MFIKRFLLPVFCQNGVKTFVFVVVKLIFWYFLLVCQNGPRYSSSERSLRSFTFSWSSVLPFQKFSSMW